MSADMAPEVLRMGQARLTAGLDRFGRIDLATHREIFGTMRRVTARQLADMAERVDLRGRGGAAFPFARKVRAVQAATGVKRRTVILVNGTEGEPGSAKDAMLLLRSPYLVLGGALLACRALGAKKIVVGVADRAVAASVSAAARSEPELKKLVQVVEVPERFVSGEGGALVNAVNGKAALPPGRKRRASDRGVDGLPTLLSNAETFAQVAVLALLGPEGFAATGTADEPGTVLLTVGGTARTVVAEVPTGTALGAVLGSCGVRRGEGVLVGGYHGAWLPTDVAYAAPVSRAGLEAAGGSLGAGIVLPLGEGTCAAGEVARIARYLAKESSGQCGPCKIGLPAVARALTALADGTGGMEAMEAARRAAAATAGRGACGHPDGVARFVLSALDVFTDDLAAHVFRGGCGRAVRGVLPLPPQAGEFRLGLDWTRCQGHGLCGRLVPELVSMDRQGYPALLDTTVPFWLQREARQAVSMCPALALRLEPAPSSPPRPALPAQPGTLDRVPSVIAAPPGTGI